MANGKVRALEAQKGNRGVAAPSLNLCTRQTEWSSCSGHFSPEKNPSAH